MRSFKIYGMFVHGLLTIINLIFLDYSICFRDGKSKSNGENTFNIYRFKIEGNHK